MNGFTLSWQYTSTLFLHSPSLHFFSSFFVGLLLFIISSCAALFNRHLFFVCLARNAKIKLHVTNCHFSHLSCYIVVHWLYSRNQIRDESVRNKRREKKRMWNSCWITFISLIKLFIHCCQLYLTLERVFFFHSTPFNIQFSDFSTFKHFLIPYISWAQLKKIWLY